MAEADLCLMVSFPAQLPLRLDVPRFESTSSPVDLPKASIPPAPALPTKCSHPARQIRPHPPFRGPPLESRHNRRPDRSTVHLPFETSASFPPLFPLLPISGEESTFPRSRYQPLTEECASFSFGSLDS